MMADKTIWSLLLNVYCTCLFQSSSTADILNLTLCIDDGIVENKIEVGIVFLFLFRLGCHGTFVSFTVV